MNQLRKNMYGIKSMGGNFKSNKKNMYGIKSMCGIFEPNRKKTCMELKSMGGNFESNKKKYVWNKKYWWKF